MERRTTTAQAIRLVGLTKQFGSGTDSAAVAGIDLEIRDGEFFSLLGPSGSG
ncbi:MAG: Fe3+/spermidine/putrescine ABC transporter ATP-binding protein, partial [Candidatus Limnocylindrus sp.]